MVRMKMISTLLIGLFLFGVSQTYGSEAESKLIEGAKIFKMPLNRVRCVAIDKDGKVLDGPPPKPLGHFEIYSVDAEGVITIVPKELESEA